MYILCIPNDIVEGMSFRCHFGTGALSGFAVFGERRDSEHQWRFRVGSPPFTWYCGAVVSEPNTDQVFTKFVVEISEAVNFLFISFPKWVIKVVQSSS